MSTLRKCYYKKDLNIQLIIAKAVIAIFEQNQIGNDSDSGLVKVFCMGLEFGTHYKQSGGGQGLTILTCMMNIMSYIDREDKPQHFIMVFVLLRNTVRICHLGLLFHPSPLA